MFKRKKREDTRSPDGTPPLEHQSSTPSVVGEGVAFDKFDPEVNKGVFRKRDASELLAALSSGDLEEKKTKKKRTRTSPRSMGTSPAEAGLPRSATAAMLETVESKAEEKEDRFILEMDRLLGEYESVVHGGTVSREVTGGFDSDACNRLVQDVRSHRLERNISEGQVDSGLEALLGEDTEEQSLEEFDSCLALDVLSLRNAFDILTDDEKVQWKERTDSESKQGSEDAELLQAVADLDGLMDSLNDRSPSPSPHPPVVAPLMDSQALKHAILADIGDGKGTSSSKLKVQRGSVVDVFRNTSALDLKKDLLSQLAGSETPLTPSEGSLQSIDLRDDHSDAAALEELVTQDLDDFGLPANDSEVNAGDYSSHRDEDEEELSDLIADLDNAMPVEEDEADVEVPVLAETHAELEKARSVSSVEAVAVGGAGAAVAVGAAAVVASSVNGQIGNTETKQLKKKKKKKEKSSKRDGSSTKKKNGEDGKEKETGEKKTKRKEGEIGGKERKHRTKEERRVRREERKERKSSVENGSDGLKSQVSRVKKTEKRKHKRKHSDASTSSATSEKHRHRHKKRSESVQSKEGKKESEETAPEGAHVVSEQKKGADMPVERTKTAEVHVSRDELNREGPIGPGPSVVHLLPPPVKVESEEKKESPEQSQSLTVDDDKERKKGYRRSVYALGPISEAGIGLDEFDFPEPEHIVPDKTLREDSRGTRFEQDGKWYFRPITSLPPPREYWGIEKKYVRNDMRTVFRYDVNAHIEEFNANSD